MYTHTHSYTPIHTHTDVIVEILAQSNLLTHNVHVISNSMRFSEQPPHTCVGFEEPIIHVLNKNEGALCDANVAYFAEVCVCGVVVVIVVVLCCV